MAQSSAPSVARLMLIRGPDRSPGCGTCPFGRDGNPSRPVPGEGPERPLWILVGEGPGSNERAQGRPFVGQSGKLLQRALDTNRAERASLWVTNALLCTPEGAGDAQKEAARVACAPRLRAELARFPGRPVLLLGAAAARTLQIEVSEPEGPIETVDSDAISESDFSEPEPEDVITSLLKNIKISKIAGALFVRDVDGTGPRSTIPTIHPAAILRGGAGGEMNARALDLLAWNLIADVGKVHRLATGRQEIFAETIEVEYEDSQRAAALVAGILAECREQRFLALDLETTSLRPHEAQIRAVGLGHPGRSICVLWEILPAATLQAVAEILADPPVAKCIHNRLYDVPVLEWRSFPVRGPIHCTLLGHHVIFPGLPHDLQRAATQFFAIPPWKAEFRGGEETPASLTRYCAIDTLACARLAKIEGRFISEGDLGRAYDMYGANAAMATRAMLTGIPLDLAENDRLDALFVKVVEESMADLLRSANDPAIRENLFQQVAMEQAKRARKSDAPDYPSRIAQRVRELVACVSCNGAGARPVAVNARCECEHPAGKHVSGPCSWSKFVKGKPEPERCACTSYRPRMKPCTACGGFGHPIFEWNPHTPDHVIGLLRARRVPLYHETKTGKVSTARLILEALRRFPEVDRLLLFRDADKMLSTFVRKVRKAAVQRVDGTWRLYPRIKVHMITARWAFEDPQCFDGETEVLTRNGWCRFDSFAWPPPAGLEVAQVVLPSAAISFTVPRWIKKEHEGELVHLQHRNLDLLVTGDHRIPVKTRRSNRWFDVEAEAVPPDHMIPVNGTLMGGTAVPPDLVTLICAAQADGSWHDGGWDFSFVKPRKIARLLACLDALGIAYSVRERETTSQWKACYKQTRIRAKASVSTTQVRELLGQEKIFGSWVLSWDLATRQRFLDELLNWDGCRRGRSYSSSDKRNVDLVQAVAAVSGVRARSRVYWGSPAQTKPNWQLDFTDRRFVYTNTLERKPVAHEGLVYCVSVPSSYVLVRRGQNVVVAGNCQNWPRANKRRHRPNLRAQVVAPSGQVLAGFDFDKQEARVIGMLSGDSYLCEHVAKIHDMLARECWPTAYRGKKEDPELYDFIKRTEYGAFYEGSIETLWANLLKDDPQVKIQDVARAVNVIKAKMPRVAIWQAMKRAQVAVAPHRLRSFLFGVQRIWPLGNASPTEVANWDVQTMGAELMAEGFRRLVAWFETRHGAEAMEAAYPAFPNGFSIILQVHDAAYFLGPESEAPSMIEAIEACFPQEYTNPANGITMQFPIETKVGRDWAEV